MRRFQIIAKTGKLAWKSNFGHCFWKVEKRTFFVGFAIFPHSLSETCTWESYSKMYCLNKDQRVSCVKMYVQGCSHSTFWSLLIFMDSIDFPSKTHLQVSASAIGLIRPRGWYLIIETEHLGSPLSISTKLTFLWGSERPTDGSCFWSTRYHA